MEKKFNVKDYKVGGNEMTAMKALFKMEECEVRKVGLMVELQHIILKDLSKLEKIEGYVNATDIIPELKIEIIKNILNGSDKDE